MTDGLTIRELRRRAVAESKRLRKELHTELYGKQPRFPFEPFAEIAIRQWRPLNEYQDTAIGLVGKVAQVLDIDTRTVYKWRQHGMTLTTADRYATELGCHPCEIWPEWLKAAG